MTVLIIDNYDSFTYNIVSALREMDVEIFVNRNDRVDFSLVEKADAIIASPGPGIPQEAGGLLDLIKNYSSKKKILGICLGQQAIAEAFGGSLRNLDVVHHGVASTMQVVCRDEPLFRDIPELFEAGRYHSWVVNGHDLPDSLEVTAIDENGEIMALRHKKLPVYGLQFHPESVLTPLGTQMLKNFLAA